MKISKEELKNMIQESIGKKVAIDTLIERKKKLEKELRIINEDFEAQTAPPVLARTNDVAPTQMPEVATEEEAPVEESKESIFDSKPGETVILNFEGVTLKIERQLDDLFKVVDAAESQKIKEGDYVKIQGNDTLERGKSYKFSIYRQTPLKYETNSLESWKIIKN